MALIDATLLGLSKVGGDFELSEYAARGVTMSMEPVDGGVDLQRDVNFNLVNLKDGLDEFKKFKFSIACEDYDSPSFAAADDDEALSPGDAIELTCLPQLGATEARTFSCLVTHWQVNRDELGAITSWSLDAEQI